MYFLKSNSLYKNPRFNSINQNKPGKRGNLVLDENNVCTSTQLQLFLIILEISFTVLQTNKQYLKVLKIPASCWPWKGTHKVLLMCWIKTFTWLLQLEKLQEIFPLVIQGLLFVNQNKVGEQKLLLLKFHYYYYNALNRYIGMYKKQQKTLKNTRKEGLKSVAWITLKWFSDGCHCFA